MKSKKLDDLEKKIEQLMAQKASEEARLKSKFKKEDTRRKILIGAYFLENAEKNGTMPDLIKQIDGFLTRKSDRALFNLDDTPKDSSNSPAKDSAQGSAQ